MDSTKKIRVGTDSAPVDRRRYHRLISHTRLDIGFSVSVVSQFMNNPTEEHMEVANIILRYLKMTLGKGLLYKKGDNKNIELF